LKERVIKGLIRREWEEEYQHWLNWSRKVSQWKIARHSSVLVAPHKMEEDSNCPGEESPRKSRKEQQSMHKRLAYEDRRRRLA